MAYRLWNQISSIKYLKHGTFRTYTSLGDKAQSTFINRSTKKQQDWFLRSSSVSGIRNLSESKDSPSDFESTKWVKQGRFVRTTPGPANPSDAVLRPALRSRIQYGAKRVSKMAQSHYQRSRGLSTPYKLRDGSDATAHEKQIRAMKRAYARKVQVARLQPHSLVPFCSNNAEKFEREDLRPHKFHVHTVKRDPGEYFATPAADMEEELLVPAPKQDDAVSIKSDVTNVSDETIKSEDTTPAVPSTSNSAKVPPTTARSQAGYNFTKFNTGTRPFSTFLKRTNDQSHGIADALETVNHIQTRTLIPIKCEEDKDCPEKDSEPNKECCRKREPHRKKTIKVYKHKGRWNKCECCPEMLDCDEPICGKEFKFPCPCENYPTMCPIDCPPPCEPPPPPCNPLCRPRKCPRYQKTKECKIECSPKSCMYVTPKCLPKLPPGNCPCVNPPLPDKMPPMKFVKKRIYQCQPCPPPPCCEECKEYMIPPKRLPPIIPGDCPCIEPKILDVPPLKRLKMDPFQKIKECKPPCIEEPVQPPKCVERKCLPPIKSDCYCIEPKPLKKVRLIRLPKICVCPPPPDPKCKPPPCPPRSDEVCCWEFPKKKLKNFWCPNCKIPSKKCKFCREHTRPRVWKKKSEPYCKYASKKFCKGPAQSPKVCKREMSTATTLRYCKACQALCMGEHTYTMRNFASFADSALTMEAGPSTQAKPATVFGVSALPPLKLANESPLVPLRQFHTTVTLDVYRQLKRHDKKKGICRKKGECPCPPFKTNCCPPRCRYDCKPRLKELCCKPKKSPYPAFSECSEFHQLLTCECRRTMPHLQPNTPYPNVKKLILPEPCPKHKIIDPLLEEHCVLADLCRPFGHTYNCENFHEGEVVPLTQYECYSPHRIPCCERDQICDFRRRPIEKTCEGITKAPEFYRCQCYCPKRKHCSKEKMYKLNSVYSKIRKQTKRHYSTMARRPIFCAASTSGTISSTITGTTNGTFNGIKPNTMAMSTRAFSKVGGHTGRPKCKRRCPKKKRKCGKPMRGARRLDIFKKKRKPMNEKISRELQAHFKKSIECQGPKGRKRILLEKAKCAAKAVGMKLVHDHDRCCKHKPPPCDGGLSGAGCKKGGCSGLPICKRPKNVCDSCEPRWEVDQCKAKKHEAPCCCMPHRMSGAEFRSIQPACCKMPIPLCNRKCLRVRADCLKEYIPCCITESPYPAFSDCHPPFKRLIRGELQWQEWLEDKTRRKIGNMMQRHNLAKANYLCKKKYSTAAHTIEEASLLNRVLSCLDRPEKAKGLHEPVKCKCNQCNSDRIVHGFRNIKPDLNRNIKSALPATSCTDDISNIPEMLFTKDDIFKEVDKDNLISLAPNEMTPMEKLKCYLFNKANKMHEDAIKVPVDGFECFVSSLPSKSSKTVTGTTSTRNYSISKTDVEEIKESTEETPNELVEKPRQIKVQPAEVITLSEPTDLIYLMNDGQTAVNLRPKSAPNKVKVITHPVCTHIMLDSGELMMEHEYQLMNTILPLKNRLYLPFGLSHEEYLALEEQSLKTVQEQLEQLLQQDNA